MKDKEKYYPCWVCHSCGVKFGNKDARRATWHMDNCGICDTLTQVTEPYDFGELHGVDWLPLAKDSFYKRLTSSPP